ncbi:F-actin-capping protein subunit alpha [Varicellaria rhodocarpa]|nr:F-actin-capping protein subunit alpha [Varicellaria rhodocarpa]
MSNQNIAAVSAFVKGAPPGELSDVIAGTTLKDYIANTLLIQNRLLDIKALTIEEPQLLQSAQPAFEKYNEEQLTAAKLTGNSQSVLISPYNSLGNGRYYDVESKSSFAFDHTTQKASAVESHNLDSQHILLVTSLMKSLSSHGKEHYPASTYSVFPTSSDSKLALVLVANKYSPSNFWNGRWRSIYIYDPSSSTLTGTIHVDVHYYEDGNVRLSTTKPVNISSVGSEARDIIRQIATAEKKYQEELNRGFNSLSEGAFKGLRRQLPVTRQKVEWEKISSYRIGQEFPGGRAR